MDLAGHSLPVTERAFHVGLLMPTVFQASTIRDMAVVIAEMQSAWIGVYETDALLKELETIRDDEMQDMLAPLEGYTQK